MYMAARMTFVPPRVNVTNLFSGPYNCHSLNVKCAAVVYVDLRSYHSTKRFALKGGIF